MILQKIDLKILYRVMVVSSQTLKMYDIRLVKIHWSRNSVISTFEREQWPLLKFSFTIQTSTFLISTKAGLKNTH